MLQRGKDVGAVLEDTCTLHGAPNSSMVRPFLSDGKTRMRVLLACVLGAGMFATPAVAQDGCKGIKSSAARLACYDKAARSDDDSGSGTVEGAITWQYNDFVGTKSDVGATVLLLRIPVEATVGQLSTEQRKILEFGIAPPAVDGLGIFSANVDGFGKFKIDGILPGKYDVLVRSGKTRPGPDDYSTNQCKENFARTISDLMFRLGKAWCTTINVSIGQTTAVSHDFGNTYF